MSMIKLTNTGQFADMPIYINVNHITSVFEVATDEGSLRTQVFSAFGKEPIVWVVQESLGQVIKAISKAEKATP
jgi:hypothetical protein